jgi:hypothetical protein
MTLTQIWKRLQFEFAARDIFNPSRTMRDEMAKDGWRFSFRPSIGGPMGPTTPEMIVRTPEGRLANYDPAEMARFRDARRKTAERLFGIS